MDVAILFMPNEELAQVTNFDCVLAARKHIIQISDLVKHSPINHKRGEVKVD